MYYTVENVSYFPLLIASGNFSKNGLYSENLHVSQFNLYLIKSLIDILNFTGFVIAFISV